jgi:hypothetical protein
MKVLTLAELERTYRKWEQEDEAGCENSAPSGEDDEDRDRGAA